MEKRFVDYEITPGEIPGYGIMFVDHEKNHRSGHLSHALVEYKKGCVMAFYSNCSATRNKWAPGHNGFGWLEYKRSTDGGKTWDKARVFPYSWDSFINQPFTVSCEKAVSTKENEMLVAAINRHWNFINKQVTKAFNGEKTISINIEK